MDQKVSNNANKKTSEAVTKKFREKLLGESDLYTFRSVSYEEKYFIPNPSARTRNAINTDSEFNALRPCISLNSLAMNNLLHGLTVTLGG